VPRDPGFARLCRRPGDRLVTLLPAAHILRPGPESCRIFPFIRGND
jgi:hypothetical protein